MNPRNARTAIAALVLLLTAATAAASAADMKGPCAADAQRFCQGVARDRPHMMQCLSAHGPGLSAPCKLALQTAAGDRAARRKACQPDIQKFCKDTGHGRGHFLECLKAHAADLSPACKRAISARSTTGAHPASPQ